MKNLLAPTIRAAIILLAAAPAYLAAQNGAPLGKHDFNALLDEVQNMPATTHEAALRTYGPNMDQPQHDALTRFYQPVRDKLAKISDEYAQYYTAKTNSFQAQTVRHQTTTSGSEAVNHPMLAQMGGIEKMHNMTPEQAEHAAKQVDPFQANGIESAGMSALYQKIINDPAYAARFQNMSDQEREAELRRYMQNDQPVANTPARQQQIKQQTQKGQETELMMQVQQGLFEIQEKITQAKQRFEQAVSNIQTAKGTHAKIDQDYLQQYEAVPEQIYGEAGKQKDPALVKKLQVETAMRHQQLAAQSLPEYRAALEQLRTDYKRTIDEYKRFYAGIRPRLQEKTTDFQLYSSTELALATFEINLLNLAHDLADTAIQWTEDTASWEKNHHRFSVR